MIGGLWFGGESESRWVRDDAVTAAASQVEAGVMSHVRDLEREIERLKLLNQALWELLRDRVGLSDADLEKVIHDVDMRDGVQDGRMTSVPLKCPRCGRVSSSKHWKCLYCGQEFEKPIAG